MFRGGLAAKDRFLIAEVKGRYLCHDTRGRFAFFVVFFNAEVAAATAATQVNNSCTLRFTARWRFSDLAAASAVGWRRGTGPGAFIEILSLADNRS